MPAWQRPPSQHQPAFLQPGYHGQGQPAVSSAQGLLAPRIMFPRARLTPEAKPRGGAGICDATLTSTLGHAQGLGTLPAPHPSEDSTSQTLTLQGPTLLLQSGRGIRDGADTEGPAPWRGSPGSAPLTPTCPGWSSAKVAPSPTRSPSYRAVTVQLHRQHILSRGVP